MSRKRLLFYLEPAPYCDNPRRLDGWLSYLSKFARRSADVFTCATATSASTVAQGTAAFDATFVLNPIAFMAPYGFDRAAYSRDLCTGDGQFNSAIRDALEKIRQVFDPDIVISVSDNVYLKHVFGADRIMYMELGPLPRHGMKQTVYVDPFGHQIGSAIDRFAVPIWSQPWLNDLDLFWKRTWRARTEREAEARGLVNWIARAKEGRRIMLVALQPPDWLTYEGIGPAIDPISLLRLVADQAEPGTILIPQWHGSDRHPSHELLEELSRCQNNILIPPDGSHIAHSEMLLPYVDAVATISSNVAAAGAIMGKELRILGASKFRHLVSGGDKTRPDLLAFFASRYCAPLDDFLNVDGAFADHILRLAAEPDWLFNPVGMQAEDITKFVSD